MRIQDIAKTLLNRTYALEQNIVNHLKSNHSTTNTSTLTSGGNIDFRSGEKTASETFRIQSRNLSANPVVTSTTNVIKSAANLASESLYDYLDDVLTSTDNLNYDNTEDIIPCRTLLRSSTLRHGGNVSAEGVTPGMAVPQVPDDWNNITLQFNQAWIQTERSALDLHNGGLVLILGIFCVILTCLGAMKFYYGLKRRKVYRQYSLVYPDEGIHSF